jgi:NAD(P)-dependent dehydrogenase (short-subunit alcohol dehydrogenase family)
MSTTTRSTRSDATAVVTGGSSGIGLAIAKQLVDQGATVVITGRSTPTLEAAIDGLGENAIAVRSDVSSLTDLDELARQVADLDGIDALFVNAGIAPLTRFESISEPEFDQVLTINVKGAYFTVQKLAPLLKSGSGVVLTTSVANKAGIVDTSVYAASKAALRSMARTLSRELLPRGIRVNAVSPGPIDTGILETMMSEEAARIFKEQRVADNPMRRFGTPNEVATAATFLAFDATYTTGAELAVDGGTTQL